MMIESWLTALTDLLLWPALWLSGLLAGGCSLLFFLWRGGTWRQLVADLVAGMVGFAAGQWLGATVGWEWLMLGEVQVALGLLGTCGVIVLGRRLGRVWAKLR